MRWIVVALLLSGCLGLDPGRADPPGQQPNPEPTTEPGGPGEPIEPEPEQPTGPQAMLLDYAYHDCQGYDGQWRVPGATAQAVVPEAFTVAEDQNPMGSATVRYTWLACASFTTPTANVTDTVFGFVAVAIEAAGAEADEHWYLLHMLTQDDVMEKLWTAAGYDVVVGDFALALNIVDGGVVAPGSYDISLGDYSATGAVTAFEAATDANVAMYTQTEEGILIWTGEKQGQRQWLANGIVEPASSDPFAGEQFAVRTASANERVAGEVHWLDNNLLRYDELPA